MHGLQHALIKAFKKNSANLNPDWLYAAMSNNHPSLYERLRAIPETFCQKGENSPDAHQREEEVAELNSNVVEEVKSLETIKDDQSS